MRACLPPAPSGSRLRSAAVRRLRGPVEQRPPGEGPQEEPAEAERDAAGDVRKPVRSEVDPGERNGRNRDYGEDDDSPRQARSGVRRKTTVERPPKNTAPIVECVLGKL